MIPVSIRRLLRRCLRAVAAAFALLPRRRRAHRPTGALQKKQMAEVVDTTKFKKPGPYTIGVAAGYLSNSWVVFCLQHIRYEASLHKDVKEVIVTDAAFNPAKQVTDIEDLIAKNVEPDHLLAGRREGDPAGAQEGGGQGHPDGERRRRLHLFAGHRVERVSSTSGRSARWSRASSSKDLGGKGKIFAMLPIAGTTAAVDQLAALKTVLKDHPNIELLAAEYGDWNRAKAKQITENLLQRYPEDRRRVLAGRPDVDRRRRGVRGGGPARRGLTMSPGDEYNGWMKWVVKNKQGGAVTFPTRAGQEATKLGLKILEGRAGTARPG